VDFLSKPVDADDLIQAVRTGIEKHRIALRVDAELTEIRQRLAKLTPREYEVLCHVVSGKLNKQIAADLGTVEKTVKVHRARVMEKVRATSLAELVRIAQRAGIQPW
jgi:FixJ family two-component response regulator